MYILAVTPDYKRFFLWNKMHQLMLEMHVTHVLWCDDRIWMNWKEDVIDVKRVRQTVININFMIECCSVFTIHPGLDGLCIWRRYLIQFTQSLLKITFWYQFKKRYYPTFKHLNHIVHLNNRILKWDWNCNFLFTQ